MFSSPIRCGPLEYNSSKEINFCYRNSVFMNWYAYKSPNDLNPNFSRNPTEELWWSSGSTLLGSRGDVLCHVAILLSIPLSLILRRVVKVGQLIRFHFIAQIVSLQVVSDLLIVEDERWNKESKYQQGIYVTVTTSNYLAICRVSKR